MNHGLLVLYCYNGINVLLAANRHGKPITINFWSQATATVIKLVLIWWALGWKFI